MGKNNFRSPELTFLLTKISVSNLQINSTKMPYLVVSHHSMSNTTVTNSSRKAIVLLHQMVSFN